MYLLTLRRPTNKFNLKGTNKLTFFSKLKGQLQEFVKKLNLKNRKDVHLLPNIG